MPLKTVLEAIVCRRPKLWDTEFLVVAFGGGISLVHNFTIVLRTPEYWSTTTGTFVSLTSTPVQLVEYVRIGSIH